MTWRQGNPAHSSQSKRFTAIHANAALNAARWNEIMMVGGEESKAA
jgi:hypothetical protein